MQNVIVTGGGGFIGSALTKALVKKGFNVTVIDNLSSGKKENLFGLEEKINFFKTDITKNSFGKAFENCDVVFHLAAQTLYEEHTIKSKNINCTNVLGTINVLEESKKNNVQKVVNFSSAAVYGNTTEIPQKETTIPCPMNVYGVQKLTGECISEYYSKKFDLETVSLRLFNVFGEGISSNPGVIPKFISNILKRERPTIYRSGEQIRDFVFLNDVVQAALLSINSNNRFHGEIINVCSGKGFSINNVFQILAKKFDFSEKPVFAKEKKSEAFISIGSTEKAKKTLGFECSESFEEGIKKTIDWYTNNNLTAMNE